MSIQRSERERVTAKNHCTSVDEVYGRMLLAHGTPLSGVDFPAELVQQKCEQIRLRRSLYSLKQAVNEREDHG